jgi:hypothetical protein
MQNNSEKKVAGNFIDRCSKYSLSDESCIMGIIIFVISFIPLFFNVYAFAKMTIFYKKLNFENSIILIAAIEIFILEFTLTTSFDIFLQFFFFLQIFSISWLIKKFSNLIKDIKSIFKKNILFISINIINLVIFIVYIICMIRAEKNIYILNLIYKIFYFISTCLLGYICIFMNRLILKHKLEYLENYNNLFEPYLLIMDNNDLIDFESLNSDGTKENSNNINSSNKNDNINENQKEYIKKGEVFYHIKKRQNKCLFIINSLCSFLELIFTIIRYFSINEDFLEDIYKIVPLTLLSEILFYFFILICFINVSAIFFSFYYYIRRQYSRNPKVYKKRLSKKLFDDAFIEEQKQKEDKIEMNEGVLTRKNKARKKSSLDENFKYIDKV